MSAREVLARELETRWGTTDNWAGHILQAFATANIAVVELPPKPWKSLEETSDDCPECGYSKATGRLEAGLTSDEKGTAKPGPSDVVGGKADDG